MEAPPPLPKKKEILDTWLGESNVFLHLDPRRPGVVVPKWFQNQPELVLQLGLRMAVPIPDLEIDEEGVSCTLSFSRAPFWCCIPWAAIFAVVRETDRGGVIWPEDIPPDGQTAKSIKPPKPRPKLAAVPAICSSEDDEVPHAKTEEEQSEPELPPIGPETKCGICATPWVEDQSTCPVCGTSAADALRPAAAEPAPEKAPTKPMLAAVPAPQAPALAAVGSDGSKKAPSSKKKPAAAPSSKKRGSRPTLVGAPSETSAEGSRAAADTPDAAPPSSDAAPATLPKKPPKRELPPYLRVVK